MELLNWLKRKPSDISLPNTEIGESTTVAAERQRATLPDLDAPAAVAAHMRWKARLEAHLASDPPGRLRADAIMRDRNSTLGRWLHSHGSARFGMQEAFADLKRHHAEFHRYAGMAVLALNSGRREDALNMISSGDYARASTRLRMALTRVFASENSPIEEYGDAPQSEHPITDARPGGE